MLTFRRTELAKVVTHIDSQEERHRTGRLSPLLERWEALDEAGER